MSDSQAIMKAALDTGSPPPLDPLTHVVISPENIAAEARLHRAQVLAWGLRRRYSRDLRRIKGQLARANYQENSQHRADLQASIQADLSELQALKTALMEDPGDENKRRQYFELRSSIESDYEHYQAISRLLSPLLPQVHQARTLSRALNDHPIAVARQKTERQLFLMMEQEARIYEALIIDRWTHLGFCHRVTVNGKTKTDKVTFSDISITLDAIFYKIDASFQTAFKHWKTNIPEGVKVVHGLLLDETLDELSVSCQRQVSGVYNTNGAWVVVHRLDSIDGLLNYVSFDQVLDRYPRQHHSAMPICVGVAAQRQVQWINLAQFPHWLIGGFTNSGKSNLVNAGLCTLISQQRPADLRIVLIDLKGGLEFNFYKGIPHLHGDLVDTVEGVALMLAQMEALMHSRFAKFRGIAKRLEEYHAKRPNDPMPRVVIVFDEVASIMDHGDTTKRIMASMREITRMGRAVGIHIWLCTQRPDVKAIEGAVKANLAVRISGRMTTGADSMTILGNHMAKDLAAVPGRMIMQLGPDPTPVQTPHITDQHITDALAVAMEYPTPPPLDIPEGAGVIHQRYTPEIIIEMSIKHWGGNITAKRVKEYTDGLSHNQSRALVEEIWNMPVIEFEGRQYEVKVGSRNIRTLVEIEPEPVAES